MIFPTGERGNGHFKEKPSTKAVFPFSHGKNRISQGVENRGSLISVPLALRVNATKIARSRCTRALKKEGQLHFCTDAPLARLEGDSGCRKRGVEFKGGSLHDGFGGFDGLAVLESTLPSFCFSYKKKYREAAVKVLMVLAVSAVVAVSVVTAAPLKLNPPFP